MLSNGEGNWRDAHCLTYRRNVATHLPAHDRPAMRTAHGLNLSLANHGASRLRLP